MSNTDKYVSKAGQVVVYGVNGDGNAEYMRVNKQFGGLLLVSPMEQSTITGSHFYTFASTSLGSTDTVKRYLVTTPNTECWAHMAFDMDGSLITQFDIYEDSNYDHSTDTSKAMTCFNAQRNSTDASGLTISEDPTTDTTQGTLIRSYKSGLSDNKSVLPWGTMTERFIVLKQNSNYLVEIDSGSDDNLLNVYFNWYEVTYSS